MCSSDLLTAWRARLAQELAKVRDGIDELERSGVVELDLLSGKASRLLDELEAVIRATFDADGCMQVVEQKRPERMRSHEARLARNPRVGR